MRVPRRSVKELLVHAKDAAELMVDLAYAAVFFADRSLAQEVLKLESELDDALEELRLVCMLAARSPEDAEGLADVIALALAMERIAGAAEDIARVELRHIGVPPELREDLRHAAEVTASVTAGEGSELVGATLREVALPSRTGMWLIAIRREGTYVFGPGGEDVIQLGDLLILQGPEEGIGLVRELTAAPPPASRPPVAHRRLTNLDRAVDLCIELKNASEVAVGLAYSSILLRDRGLATEVGVLEDRTDALWSELEGWVLRAAREAEDPASLRGLLHLGSASERIADAAQAMTRIIEDDELPHPVIAQALTETDEIVAEALVHAGAPVEGRTLKDLRLQTETGMEILAIERGGRWIYRPRPSRSLQPDDRVLAIGPEEGAPLLRELCGDRRPPGEEGWHEPEEDDG
ncbi:MAG: potassium channel family protein [Nitriliruptorales bacterium]